MPHKSFDTYEEWNLTLPPIPERSVLFALEPVGVGTPWVESLTSYITRLAHAHAVFPGVLMNKLLKPLAQGNHAHLLHISEGKKTNLLNATGLRARLEITTCARHHTPFCQQCPNPACARFQPALCWRSRPGFCAYCQQWLGEPLEPKPGGEQAPSL